MLELVLDLLFPNVCGFCGKIYKSGLCPKCNVKIKLLIKEKEQQYQGKYFESHMYLFNYEGIIRQKIIEYKFQDKPELSQTFAQIILNNKKVCGLLKKYDIIIPVPMYYKKQNIRGYNQASLIASKIAENMENMIFYDDCLIKEKDNKKQSTLDKKERIENVKNVYKINNKQKIINKKIIIFDDIYTTGNTVNECSRVLKQAGVKEVLILTIAKD